MLGAERRGRSRLPDGHVARSAGLLQVSHAGQARRQERGVDRPAAYAHRFEQPQRPRRLLLGEVEPAQIEEAVRLLVGEVGLAEVADPARFRTG
jgi:hypothetical protein